MTTIITIVVVALVFFVTICVVAFMIWKRETEMRTDSIKAIEYNVEEMLYELTGSSSREIRRGRTKRGEDVGREQGGTQQEIIEKQDDADRARGSDPKTAQDPFGWMRKESADDPGRREENADAEVKARENITVFEPAVVQYESYERRRSGADAANTGRYGLRWTEVSEEKREEPQEEEPERDILPEAEAVPTTVIMSETAMRPQADAMPEVVTMQEASTMPEAHPMSAIMSMPAMRPVNVEKIPAMPESHQTGNWSQATDMQPQQVPQPQQVSQSQQIPQPLPEQPREGGMISKLLKRRKKQKDSGEQEQQNVLQAEGPKPDPLYGWVESYEARNTRQTEYSPDVYEASQEEQIYEPYKPYRSIGQVGADLENIAGHPGGHAGAGQMDQEDEWKEKTVEDLLREYIDGPSGSEAEESSTPAGMGYNVGKSGRKYTVEELETLIKE